MVLVLLDRREPNNSLEREVPRVAGTKGCHTLLSATGFLTTQAEIETVVFSIVKLKDP